MSCLNPNLGQLFLFLSNYQNGNLQQSDFMNDFMKSNRSYVDANLTTFILQNYFRTVFTRLNNKNHSAG